ncbi:MAG: restriction endonuclease subunit S, partial [Deltaproteobacteria bacterium]
LQLSLGSIVAKEKIAANGDYGLSGDRYREGVSQSHTFPLVQLGDVFKLSSGRGLTQSNMLEGIYPVYGGNGKTGTHSEYLVEAPNIVIGRVGAYCGAVHITEPKAWITDNALYVTEYKQEIDQNYLAIALDKLHLNQFAKVGGQPSISQMTVYECKIPLPTMDVQKEIVAEIEGYQKVINGARAVLDNYRPHIPILPEWPLVEIGSLVTINNGYVLTELPEVGTVACVKVGDMNLPENQREIVTSSHWLPETDKPLLPIGSVIFPKRGAAIATNKKRITRIPCLIDNNCMGLIVRPDSGLVTDYLYNFLLGFDLSTISNSAGIALINNGDISTVLIPLPPLNTQQQIVAEIEAEQSLVNANRELIERFEKKIQATLARVWGEKENP